MKGIDPRQIGLRRDSPFPQFSFGSAFWFKWQLSFLPMLAGAGGLSYYTPSDKDSVSLIKVLPEFFGILDWLDYNMTVAFLDKMRLSSND